jgi:hypothetical protein
MPHQYSFDRKLERANEHLLTLDNQIESWTLKKPYILTTDFDPERGKSGLYAIKVKLTVAPPIQIPVLIGECLFNLRCALDHLVFTLTEIRNRGPLSDEVARRTEFPIFHWGTEFCNKGMRKIRGIHPDAQTLIKSLQPYHAGNEFRCDWLWLLNEMQNIDKHRTLLLTYMAHRGAMTIPVPPNNFPRATPLGMPPDFRYIRNLAPFEREAIVAEYGFNAGEPHMKMNFEPLLQIAFSQPPAKGREIVSFLRGIRDYIAIDVLPTLRTFL